MKRKTNEQHAMDVLIRIQLMLFLAKLKLPAALKLDRQVFGTMRGTIGGGGR